MNNNKHIFAKIEKFNDEQQIVEGYASTEALDSDGEIITIEALKNALSDYMLFPSIREMHQAMAAGVTKAAFVDEKGLYISAKIVDPIAWLKVKEGVYRCFSVGGLALEKIGNKITKFLMLEISLVDRGANPEAIIEVVKMSKDKKQEIIEELENKDVPVVEDKEEPVVKEEDKLTEGEAKQKQEDESIANTDKNHVEEIKESINDNNDVLNKFASFMKSNNISVDDFASLFAKKEEASVEKSDKQEEVKEVAEVSEVKKSFYSIQDLACVLSSLSYISDDVEWEAEYKNEEMELVNKVKALLSSASELLKEMIDKEVSSQVEKSASIDLISAKLGVNKTEEVKEEISKGFKTSISEKDAKIVELNSTIESLKKSMTFDTKEQAKEAQKVLAKHEFSKDKENSIEKSLKVRETELKDKIAKCDDSIALENFKRELNMLEFTKANFM